MKYCDILYEMSSPYDEEPMDDQALEAHKLHRFQALDHIIKVLKHRMSQYARNQQDVPEKLSRKLEAYKEKLKTLGPKIPFENPYAKATQNTYIGDPSKFPNWTKQMLKQFIDMKSILRDAGLGPLTIMYYGEHYSGPARRPYLNRNFAVVGAHGNFIWRKYEQGEGSGMNWIYLDGKKMKTSEFLGMDSKKRKQLLQVTCI